MPGKQPRRRSSRLGLVAEVIAIESPSQPRPVVSHMTLIGCRSGSHGAADLLELMRSRGPLSGRRLARYAGPEICGSLDQRLQMDVDRAMQVPPPGRAGDDPAV